MGMATAYAAQRAPDRPAIVSARGNRSFGELNANTNRLVRALRERGLRPGDSVALLCSNRPEFAEVRLACMRGGWRFTPINWHLQPDEVRYVVEDCEARAFVAEERVADAAIGGATGLPGLATRLSVGSIDGFERYDAALDTCSADDIVDPQLGRQMLYTSGTTGRPKGVSRPPLAPQSRVLAQQGRPEPMRGGQSVVLCTGPLYHAAPLAGNLALPLDMGVTVVLMDKWDPEETLQLIDAHGVTHTHMVSTMFHRLLALPEGVRGRYDVSSLRRVTHGAAPTPVHVKRAMIEWLGPILYEYYAATEGGGTGITSSEWLEKPGSVGRPVTTRKIEILDADGNAVATGSVGTVYFAAPEEGAFEYYKDPGKTAQAYRGDLFTLGDQGYVDEDGYLFLTGRSSEVIIAGGVNIYPSEVDAVLLMHPAIADAATVGIPHSEFGEEVRAVVQLANGREPTQQLTDELIAFCRDHLAKYKCPRGVDYDPALPRSDAGKVQRALVRARYWKGRDKQI